MQGHHNKTSGTKTVQGHHKITQWQRKHYTQHSIYTDDTNLSSSNVTPTTTIYFINVH